MGGHLLRVRLYFKFGQLEKIKKKIYLLTVYVLDQQSYI